MSAPLGIRVILRGVVFFESVSGAYLPLSAWGWIKSDFWWEAAFLRLLEKNQ